jgi:hypothetical protein
MFGSPRTGSTWLLELLAYPLILEAREPVGFRVPAELERPIDVIPINESLLPSHLAPRSPRMRQPASAPGSERTGPPSATSAPISSPLISRMSGDPR